jgi:hypothetical protein
MQRRAAPRRIVRHRRPRRLHPAARGRARDTVARDCDGEQLTALRYVDLGDAQADVINICRQLDTAASSAAFAPASFGGTIAAMSGADQTCVDTTSRAGNALLRYAMRTRQRASTRSPPPSCRRR